VKKTEKMFLVTVERLAARPAYGAVDGKPAIAAELVDYDIDIERGFTAVIIDARVRNVKTGRMPKKAKMVYGYAKRRAGDVQDEEIGLNKAIADAMRRALAISRI
jgi:hypothetical protein